MLDAPIRCFYSFQKPCIPNHSLTRQQRCSGDLNFETETGLKLQDHGVGRGGKWGALASPGF